MLNRSDTSTPFSKSLSSRKTLGTRASPRVILNKKDLSLQSSLSVSRRSMIGSQNSSRSSSRSISIMDYDRLSQGIGLGEIRPSLMKPIDKEVILLTPVIIGNKDLPSSFIKEKVNYQSGSALTRDRTFPQTANDMIGGVLIRMPTQGIKDYLHTIVKLESLMSDDDMIRFLE